MAGAVAEKSIGRAPQGRRLEVVRSPLLSPEPPQSYEQRRHELAGFLQGLAHGSPGHAAVIDHIAFHEAFSRPPNDPKNIDSTGRPFVDEIDLAIQMGTRKKDAVYRAALQRVQAWTNEAIERRKGNEPVDAYDFYKEHLANKTDHGATVVYSSTGFV